MAVVIYPLLLLAIAGFIAILVVHLAALGRVTYPFEHWLRFLAPGLFVIWFPTVLIAGRITRDFKQKDFWRAVLRGCPKWMRWAAMGVFGYAWIGFFAFPAIYGGDSGAQAMSAVLLSFYGIAVAVLFSSTRIAKFDESRRCTNNHRVSPLAKYCEDCGAPVQNTPV